MVIHVCDRLRGPQYGALLLLGALHKTFGIRVSPFLRTYRGTGLTMNAVYSTTFPTVQNARGITGIMRKDGRCVLLFIAQNVAESSWIGRELGIMDLSSAGHLCSLPSPVIAISPVIVSSTIVLLITISVSPRVSVAPIPRA
jgi:hypothetical protein